MTHVVESGDEVVVTADGFAPGSDVDITLHPSPVLLARVTADATGSIIATATIPPGTPPDLHHVVVTGTGPTGAALSYWPGLTVTIGALPPTSTIEPLKGTIDGSPINGLFLLLVGSMLGSLLMLNTRRRRPVIG